MAFDERDLQEIKDRIRVSDLVGSYFPLLKKGQGEYVAKDNQSFTVNDSKKIWCEFGSGGDGKGHDVFEFMQTYAGLTFPDAVRELAQQAGVPLADGPRRTDAAPVRSRTASKPDQRSDGSSRPAAQEAGDDRPETRVAKTSGGKREVIQEWDYRDSENALLYQVVRMQERLPDGSWRMKGGKPWKSFLQRRPSPDNDGTWILGLDVINRDTDEPYEFLKTEKSSAWLRATDERREWKNITVRTFEGAGNVNHWLYNANAVLDELQEPKDDQRPIFLPEGEGKVDVLTEWGLLAVTNSGGAKNFTDECAAFFSNARQVIILQDNDRAGSERVAKLAPMLKAIGVQSVQALNFKDVWLHCPMKGDVKDWRDQAGGTRDSLLEIVDSLKEWQPEPYKSKYGAKVASDLSPTEVKAYPWRIKGILPMFDSTLLMGPSRSGKTFEMLDMSIHLQTGEPFAGRKVIPCGVVYLTYEGSTGFENRLRAYLKHYDMSVADLHSFAWITRPPNLFESEDNAKALAAEILEIAKRFKVPLGLVVIDTHNAASRGSSEIKSEDINRILNNYQALKDITGVPQVIVGHTNAEGKHRGNEQFFNNIETAILVERVYTDSKSKIEKRDDNGRVVRRGVIQKQREGDDRVQWEFVLEPIEIGTDEDGDPITSMVSVEPAQHIPGEVLEEQDRGKPRPEGFYLKGHDIGIFQALLKAIDEVGKAPPGHLGIASSVTKVVKWSDLSHYYRRTVPHEDGDTEEKYRVRLKARTRRFGETLLPYNVIGILQEPGTSVHYVWPTGRRVYGKGLRWPAEPPKKKEQKPILAPGEREDDIPESIF